MKNRFFLYSVVINTICNANVTLCVEREVPMAAVIYRTEHNVEAFCLQPTYEWKNNGIFGKYSTKARYFAVKQQKLGSYDVESMLGYCRRHFIGVQTLKGIPSLNPNNIKSDKMRSFYERSKKEMIVKFGVSETNAQKLAFVTCHDVGIRECREVFNSLLENPRNRIISRGLTRSYNLEEAYIILHMHPHFYFWESFSSIEHEIYVNLIAGALNAIIHKGDGSMIQVSDCSNRCSVLRMIVDSYFETFIMKSKAENHTDND